MVRLYARVWNSKDGDQASGFRVPPRSDLWPALHIRPPQLGSWGLQQARSTARRTGRTFTARLGIFRGTRVTVPLNLGNDSVEVSRAQATGAVRWVEGWEEREEWVWAFEVENKAGNYKATPRNLSTWEIDRMVDEAEKYKVRIRLNTPVDTGYTPAVRTPKQADKRFMAHDILRALGKTPLDDDCVQYAKRRAMESSQVEEEPVVMARISSNEPFVKSTPPTSPSGLRTGTPAPSMPMPVSLPMPVPPWQPIVVDEPPIEEIAMLEEGEKEEEPEPQREPEINLMELK
ncbi:hypothetical protein B0H14DRAFT_3653630 [Mycena olivaceomarginata]|nr:hypothetical protein B0H14DRAFT_3653630 [Mycena olivaceomarginata]